MILIQRTSTARPLRIMFPLLLAALILIGGWRSGQAAELNADSRAEVPAAPAGSNTDDDIRLLDASTWSPLGNGLTSSVRVMAEIGSDVYAGGTFTSIPGCVGGVDTACARIARWDGTSWHPLNLGLNNYPNGFAVLGTDLYVVGIFSSIPGCTGGSNSACGRAARWDGTAWHPLNAGVGGTGFAVTVDGSDVYVGGDFTSITGCSSGTNSDCSRIARWDGTTWHPISQAVNGRVYDIEFIGTDMYVSGQYSTITGCVGGSDSACSRIARWDGSQWHPLNIGYTSHVYDMAVMNGELYAVGAAGQFRGCASGVDSHCSSAARWDGSQWQPLGQGLGTTRAVEVSGNNIFFGGEFGGVTGCVGGSSLCSRVARWDGSQWQPLNQGVGNDRIFGMKATNDHLYVGGLFLSVPGCDGGDALCAIIARWDIPSQPPNAVADTPTTPEDTPIAINLVGNDSDPDGQVLSVDSFTQPANGTAVISGTTGVTYTPTANFNGDDVFTYVVSNGTLTDTGTVTVDVTPVNDAPVAVDDTATMDEDNAISIDLTGNDRDVDGIPSQSIASRSRPTAPLQPAARQV